MWYKGVFAQERSNAKQDVIQKVNGEEMKGQVVKVTDSEVTFIYSGENAQYVIKKSEIARIVHASGRIENIGQQSLPAQNREKDPVRKTLMDFCQNIRPVIPYLIRGPQIPCS